METSLDFKALGDAGGPVFGEAARARIAKAVESFWNPKRPVRKAARLSALAEKKRTLDGSVWIPRIAVRRGTKKTGKSQRWGERVLIALTTLVYTKKSLPELVDGVGIKAGEIVLSLVPFKQGRPREPWRALITELHTLWTSAGGHGLGVWHNGRSKDGLRWKGQFLDLVYELVQQLKGTDGSGRASFPLGVDVHNQHLGRQDQVRERNGIGDSIISILRKK